ncbi:MAG: helix-turn-helix domain-containing protein, partial [Nitrospinota bacterium]
MITEIGQRLRKLRKSKGYDQDALAQASGITQSAISNIETGTTKNPSSDTLTKLANALGIPVGDLYGQRALSQQISEARAPYGPREVILRPASSLEGPGKAISADYLEIPLVTGRVAAGASQAVDEEIEPSPVLIHAAQVRGRHDLVAVRVVGNSMLPILQPGSIVAIDRGDKRITPGGIY